jgi:hypothetical protein
MAAALPPLSCGEQWADVPTVVCGLRLGITAGCSTIAPGRSATRLRSTATNRCSR